MKNIKILLFTLFAYFSSNAQDPQLFETDWYLQKVVIDEVDYFPPSNEELLYIKLIFDMPNIIISAVCDQMSAGIQFIGPNQFEMSEAGFTLGGCMLNENSIFQDIYFFEFFIEPISDLPYNPFTYSISNQSNDLKTLILTNNNEDYAVYGSELLSTQDYLANSFSVYPNPVQNTLSILNISNNTVNVIKVYDVLGRLILHENNPAGQLDVSALASGFLFIQIETDKGVIIKKIIKK